MNIKYNNVAASAATNLITFSDLPNVLTITDESGGTYAVMKISVTGDGFKPSTEASNQWWITIQDNTISNVLEPQNAVNKNFYVNTDNRSTALSIANALRNCPTIASKFSIYLDKSASNADVYLKAREVGYVDLSYTMADNLSNFITISTTAGTTSSVLTRCKVYTDVYSNNEYVTTLSKYFYGNETSFDMSPVLSTMTEKYKTKPYDLYIYSSNPSGTVVSLGAVSGNNTTYGNAVNGGDRYLTVNTGITIAQNVDRGTIKPPYNNTLLYVYPKETIPFSVYTSRSSSLVYNQAFYTSANELISSGNTTISVDGTVNKLKTFNIPVSPMPANAFYMDINIEGKRLRYNVIRPANTSYGYMRLNFVNSYGGTSFIDLVGEKSIEHTAEQQTYNKNYVDFYTSTINEKELTYGVTTKTVYTVKSHLIDGDGRWLYYDLLQSPYVWTKIDNTNYAVIVESVTPSEVNNQNIYEMSVKFRISQPTSL